LSAAQRAVRQGLPERALLVLAEHAWRFPNGQLADAREVTRIAALCQAGNRSLARTERARFLDRHPESPFIDRVRALCR
jgi:outer membrane protein assembly factor BamD (BamD/ComL family)